jgi:hypothetical protein
MCFGDFVTESSSFYATLLFCFCLCKYRKPEGCLPGFSLSSDFIFDPLFSQRLNNSLDRLLLGYEAHCRPCSKNCSSLVDSTVYVSASYSPGVPSWESFLSMQLPSLFLVCISRSHFPTTSRALKDDPARSSNARAVNPSWLVHQWYKLQDGQVSSLHLRVGRSCPFTYKVSGGMCSIDLWSTL